MELLKEVQKLPSKLSLDYLKEELKNTINNLDMQNNKLYQLEESINIFGRFTNTDRIRRQPELPDIDLLLEDLF